MLVKRVCIVGVGLMGGSMALALRLAQRTTVPRFPLHLTLVDRDPKTREAVKNLANVVTADFAEGVAEAELVILATPVRTVVHLLGELARIRPFGCMVMDIGSSKAAIENAMNHLPATFQAIGGHPMCGRETAGFSAATPDLFRKQTFVLCRNARTTPAIEEQAHRIVNLIGANLLLLPAELHDNIVAVVSHLPYVVAAALMRNAATMGDEHVWLVSSTGFRDTSRISGTDPTMMLDILLTNKTAVLDQLAHYQADLSALQKFIETEDEVGLRQWLTETQKQYLEYRRNKR
ncbi:MAG: prephenate dehydrogenase [Chloroflexi bacterium]|nr:MAG: prephenate dehydrogenase [Chloroflexota bacterium]